MMRGGSVVNKRNGYSQNVGAPKFMGGSSYGGAKKAPKENISQADFTKMFGGNSNELALIKTLMNSGGEPPQTRAHSQLRKEKLQRNSTGYK